jgi:hypothetical protein
VDDRTQWGRSEASVFDRIFIKRDP